MIYCNRIDVYEETDVNKTSESKKSDICCYWYFLNKGFEFEQNVSNWFRNLLMMSMNLSNIAISNIKYSNYRCIISGTSKNEAID